MRIALAVLATYLLLLALTAPGMLYEGEDMRTVLLMPIAVLLLLCLIGGGLIGVAVLWHWALP